jgi:hypothetical protein
VDSFTVVLLALVERGENVTLTDTVRPAGIVNDFELVTWKSGLLVVIDETTLPVVQPFVRPIEAVLLVPVVISPKL